MLFLVYILTGNSRLGQLRSKWTTTWLEVGTVVQAYNTLYLLPSTLCVGLRVIHTDNL